eukprot:GILK01012739.1.p1 GENE.GILK01012739.1~~GILK01012739.1.p1  ORF type:complete len:102 (+),score=6.42 GILK01012739.1:34-339(+)
MVASKVAMSASSPLSKDKQKQQQPLTIQSKHIAAPRRFFCAPSCFGSPRQKELTSPMPRSTFLKEQDTIVIGGQQFMAKDACFVYVPVKVKRGTKNQVWPR